jgi:hypothetical protein
MKKRILLLILFASNILCKGQSIYEERCVLNFYKELYEKLDIKSIKEEFPSIDVLSVDFVNSGTNKLSNFEFNIKSTGKIYDSVIKPIENIALKTMNFEMFNFSETSSQPIKFSFNIPLDKDSLMCSIKCIEKRIEELDIKEIELLNLKDTLSFKFIFELLKVQDEIILKDSAILVSCVLGQNNFIFNKKLFMTILIANTKINNKMTKIYDISFNNIVNEMSNIQTKTGLMPIEKKEYRIYKNESYDNISFDIKANLKID